MDETLNDAQLDSPYTPMMRMRAVVDTDRLDIAAIIWMTGVLVYVGSGICFAVLLRGERNSPLSDGWTTVAQLGHTIDLSVLAALVIGLAIAAAFDSVLSRAAALLGAIVGAWAAVAGLLRIAYQAAAPDKQLVQARGQSIFEYGQGFVVAALGALVLVAALRLYTTVRYDFDSEDEDDEGAGEDALS